MSRSKRFYVYVHHDAEESVFYVGKGTGRRAWSKDRHHVWHKYVEERLGGKYLVKILRDDLVEEEAEEIEASLIDEYGEQLVNWINPGRQFDYEAIERYHELRDANRAFVEETKEIEGADPGEAVARYRQALERLREYETIVTERGLVAELSDWPKHGYPWILDRLTLCLIKLGRLKEAMSETDAYMSDFPGALDSGLGKRVLKRLEKEQAKLGKGER